jgi:hypothetical protein
MKIILAAFSWTAIVLGVCSSGLAQYRLTPVGGEASLPDDSLLRSVHSPGGPQPDFLATPVVSTDNFPQPISNIGDAPCGDERGGCCANGYNDSCDGGSCSLFPGYRVKFVPYGWLSEIHGNATVRGVTQNLHVSSRDLVELLQHDVHFFFMGKLEIEQEDGPFGIITNGYYINAGLANDIEGFSFFKKYEQAMVDVAFKYELSGIADVLHLPACSKVDLLAGFRYWMFDLGVTVTGKGGGTASFNGKREWVDPFMGTRVFVPLDECSNFQFRADFGGFSWGTASKYTWNIESLIETQWTSNCALRAGYRILDVDNRRGSGGNRFAFDVQYRGPVIELAITF